MSSKKRVGTVFKVTLYHAICEAFTLKSMIKIVFILYFLFVNLYLLFDNTI